MTTFERLLAFAENEGSFDGSVILVCLMCAALYWPILHLPSHIGGDQGLLNDFFGPGWHRLPYVCEMRNISITATC